MAQKTTTTKKSSSTSANTSALAGERDKLVADLKLLISDAQSLTETAGDESKEFVSAKADELREQMAAAMDCLKEHGENLKKTAIEKSDEVEQAISTNPWKSIGIAVVAGIIIDRLVRK